jgi:hypothetical protein
MHPEGAEARRLPGDSRAPFVGISGRRPSDILVLPIALASIISRGEFFFLIFCQTKNHQESDSRWFFEREAYYFDTRGALGNFLVYNASE